MEAENIKLYINRMNLLMLFHHLICSRRGVGFFPIGTHKFLDSRRKNICIKKN